MDDVLGKFEDSQAGRVLVVDDGEVVGDHHSLGPDPVAGA
jgi:hypothetical protein